MGRWDLGSGRSIFMLKFRLSKLSITKKSVPIAKLQGVF